MEYGYVRVSTREQNERRQLAALREFGIEADRIYMDKQSGKNFERAQYQRLLDRLERGDTLVVKSIDRLGRNYEEILEQWRMITKEKGAGIVVIGNLTNRASDYRFQPNYRQNAFLTRVKAALEFGLLPDYLMSLYSEFSPVDLTAEGIVKIAQYADRQTVFHLNSNRPIYFDRLLQVLHELGIPMKVVDGGTFREALRKTSGV